MKQIFKRIIVFLGIALAVVYVGYQIYAIAGNHLSTENAVRYTVSDTISGKGVVFRDETVIDTPKNNVVVYEIDAGAKIAKGAVVANIYQNESDAITRQRIWALQNKMNLLTSVSSFGNTSNMQTETIYNQIIMDIGALQSVGDQNVFSGESAVTALSADLLRKNILTDGSVNLSGQIQELQTTIDQMESMVSNNYTSVTSPSAGYFVGMVDDLEEQCSVKNMYSYSAEQILSLPQGVSVQTSNIGKIITSFQWYYAAVIDEQKAKSLSEGDSVTISFPFTNVNDISATVEKIVTKDNAAIVYVKSTYMSAPISNIRSQDIQIKTKTYSGIRIPTKAIHVINGEKGVYIRMNNVVHFKKLNIIYEADGFVISSPGESGSDILRMYDEVIIEGKDLYDGKML